MPTTALKHLAKKANISLKQAELFWAKASNVVKSEYDIDEHDGKFWALTTSIAKKMMGLKESISFKQFIQEAPAGANPKISQLEVDEAIKLLNLHCKDALWMLHDNQPIYRGDNALNDAVSVHGFAVVDPSKTRRVSQNTTNYYTEILDNHPDYKDFPKRSASYIAAMRTDIASGYGRSVVLIPYDGVKIGCVNANDIWHVSLDLGGGRPSMATINRQFWSKLGIPPDWKAIKAFDAQNPRNSSTLRTAILSLTSDYNDRGAHTEFVNDFLGSVLKLYSIANTKFTVKTTKDVKDTHGEVWVGGPCIAISYSMWMKLINSI